MMMMIERNSALPTLRYVTMLALSARAIHPVIVSPRWGSGLFKRSSLVIEHDCTPFRRAFSTSRITRANERMGLHTDSEPTSIRSRPWATMMTEQWRPYMSPQNLQRALTAQIFHKCQIGILDDLIDKGNYSYLEAKDLHHVVLSSMIDPDFESTTFTKRLVAMLKQEQVPLFDLIDSITRGFNGLWNNSPQGNAYFYQVEVLSDRIALGQALTMFHKESLFSIPKMRKLSEAFYAPSEDLTWWEKLGAHTSAATMYNLIDMAFTNEHFDLKALPNFLTGWYYYDAAIILMDHIVSIYQDLRNGIANLSLIAMREDELSGLTTLKGYNPHLTMDDYDQHLRRIAYLTSKGLEFVDKDFHDESMYYPFITIMMPVVMMADWIGNRDDMIHAFLDSIAPAIKRVAGNGNVPTRAIVEVADEVGRPA